MWRICDGIKNDPCFLSPQHHGILTVTGAQRPQQLFSPVAPALAAHQQRDALVAQLHIDGDIAGMRRAVRFDRLQLRAPGHEHIELSGRLSGKLGIGEDGGRRGSGHGGRHLARDGVFWLQRPHRIHHQLGVLLLAQGQLSVQNHQAVGAQEGDVALVDLGKHQPLNLPGQILQGKDAHHRALLGDLALAQGQDARHADLRAVIERPVLLALGHLTHVGDGCKARSQQLGHLVQRVAGDIDAVISRSMPKSAFRGCSCMGGTSNSDADEAPASRPMSNSDSCPATFWRRFWVASSMRRS